MKHISNRRKQFPTFAAAALFLALYPLEAPRAQTATALSEKFDYNGDVLFQGFYLARDLPLQKQTADLCPSYFTSSTTGVTSRCREEEDFLRMRFRLNLGFAPSPNVDIKYGLEVGFLNFGRDETDLSGPGTGGRGSGRTNLETRELILKIKNKTDSTALSLGIFSISTPKGIVLATSGAGLRFRTDVSDWNSSFSANYIRAVDNSRVDDDSNGFSDNNYARIHLGLLSWKFSGLRWLRSELYSVHRLDDDPSSNDPTDSKQETSMAYWVGFFMQFKFGRWTVILHPVGNFGHFHRPWRLQSPVTIWLPFDPIAQSVYDQYLLREPNLDNGLQLRKKYPIRAGAGQAEVTYRLTDTMELTAAAAGGSGRLGTEPDGSSVDFRKDQFRTAGSGFQFSELGLDSNGGYTLFADGKLTGVYEAGLIWKFQMTNTVEVRLGYFNIHYYRTPSLHANKYYKQFLRANKANNYVGEEYNANFVWRVLADLNVEGRLAYFNAGGGYKALNDIEYGDAVFESAIGVTQKF